jgi:hypothetical protein
MFGNTIEATIQITPMILAEADLAQERKYRLNLLLVQL